MFDTFKPNLFPNNKKGSPPNWEERISNPRDWKYSNKLDGMRVLLYQGVAYSRTKKVIASDGVQLLAQSFYAKTQHSGIIEAEFYSPDMTFSELSYFFKKKNVSAPSNIITMTKRHGTPQWKYPGRDVQWATTWHPSLKFHIFDWYCGDRTDTKAIRLSYIDALFKALPEISVMAEKIPHHTFTHIDEFYQAYDQAMLDGCEGLMVTRKTAPYKFGRFTEKENQGYKAKEDHVPFVGKVLDVLESTVVAPGVPKTTNEMGRSVTSKKKDDRLLSGMAGSLRVKLLDGRECSVQLSGFNHPERVQLLQTKYLINTQITFYGMEPTKPGGSPRGGMYVKPKNNL